MAEKKLNVRLALKYDTYDRWTTLNPVLLKGEVAIAVVPTEDANGVSQHLPAVLIKVGDGTHTYNELDFIQAKAADVLTACKSSEGLTEYINNVIENAGIASSEAMTALTNRVTSAESDIDDLQNLVGTESVASQITKAISDLNLSETYDAKGSAETALNEAKSYADELNAAMDTRVDTAETKLTTLIGSDANKSVRAIANEELVAQLIPEAAKESLDTMQEIAAWIQSHPDDVATINVKITELENKAHTHDNKNVLDGITESKITAWDKVSEKANEADLSDIAKSGNVADLIQGDTVITLDCGSATI